MATLSELTVQILTSRMAKKETTLEEIQKEMISISNMIKAIESGTLQEPAPTVETPAENTKPQLTIKQAFKKDEIVCMICGKGGFKILKKHLQVAHNLKPTEYKKQFGIKPSQKLAAKSYSESRRQMALERNLGDGLARARAAKAAEKANVPAVKGKVSLPAIKIKAAVPAVKVKAPVPTLKVKNEAPATPKKTASKPKK